MPALGSFEGWARTVGGMLANAGIAGFLSNLDELYQRVDEDGAQWQAFFSAWHDALGETEITVAELVKRLKAAIHTESPRGAERGAQSGGGSNLEADGKALLEALPDYLFVIMQIEPTSSSTLPRRSAIRWPA